MLYNKHTLKKINDKKLLHKIGKHWVTVSIALLGLLGGGTTVIHINTSANAINDDNQNQTNHQTNVDQLQNSKATLQTNNQSNHSSQYVQNNQNQIYNNQSGSTKGITQESNLLHNRILRNAIDNNAASHLSLNNNKYSNDNTNNNYLKSTYNIISTNNSSNSKAPSIIRKSNWDNVNVNYWSNRVMELTGNGSINASDVPNMLPNINNLDELNDWKLKINNNSHIILNNNNHGGYFSANYHPIWKNFSSMDLSGLDTSNITNMNSMFENDSALDSLNVSNFNTSNVTNMNYMFNGVGTIKYLNLSNFDTRKASMIHFLLNMPDVIKTGPLFNLNSGAINYSVINNDNQLSSDYNSQNNNPAGLMNGSTLYSSLHALHTLYPSLHRGSGVLESNISNVLDDEGPILMDANGNNVTTKFHDNTLNSGIYYTAYPVTINLNNQNGQGYYLQNAVMLPHIHPIISDVETHNNYDINTSINGFNYQNVTKKQLSSIITHTNVFNNDYTIDDNQNYSPKLMVSSILNDMTGPYYVNINVHENYPKFIQDANSVITNDLNKANNFKPYAHNLFGYSSDISNINKDFAQSQHDLSEPINWNTVKDISNAENEANNNFENIINSGSNPNSPLDNDIQDGNYHGLNYKYNPNKKSLEFTNGTLTWNGDNNGHGFLSNEYLNDLTGIGNKMSNIFQNVNSIKFDNDINTNNLTNAADMFANDRQLEYLDLGNNFNTSNVINMSNMFANDYNLRQLNVNSLNTNHVTNMNNMFGFDGKLSQLDLSNFNTANVTNMNNMFGSDSSLQQLNIGNFDTSKVTVSDMSDDPSGKNYGSDFMLRDDSALKSLTLGNKTNLSVPDVDKQTVYSDIPFFQDNVDANGNDTTNEIMNGTQPSGTYYVKSTSVMYHNNINKDVKSASVSLYWLENIPKAYSDTSDITPSEVSSALSEDSSASSIISSNVNLAKNASTAINNDDNSANPTSLTLSNANSEINDINNYIGVISNATNSAINSYENHTDTSNHIVTTKNWDGVNVNYWSNDVMELTGTGTIKYDGKVPSLPFNSNKNDWILKIIPNNSNVTFDDNGLGFDFSGDNNVWNHFKAMYLSGINTSSMTNMSGMFASDPSLQILDLNGWDTDNVSNMNGIFRDDGFLKDINLSTFNTKNVGNPSKFNDSADANHAMSFMFENDNNLQSLALGPNTNLNKSGQDWGANTNDVSVGINDIIPFFINNIDKNGANSTSLIKKGIQPFGVYQIQKNSSLYHNEIAVSEQMALRVLNLFNNIPQNFSSDNSGDINTPSEISNALVNNSSAASITSNAINSAHSANDDINNDYIEKNPNSSVASNAQSEERNIESDFYVVNNTVMSAVSEYKSSNAASLAAKSASASTSASISASINSSLSASTSASFSSNENNMNIDEMFINNDSNQIKQYAENSDVLSNPSALSMINSDSNIAASAYQAVANDQVNPISINASNASQELSVATSADQEAQQVASSVMNSAASASAANHSNNTPSNNNSASNTNHSNVTPPSPSDNHNHNHQSTPSDTPSDNNTPEDNNSDEDSGDNTNDDGNTGNNDTDGDNSSSNGLTDTNSDNAINGAQQETNGTNNSSLPQTGDSSDYYAIGSLLTTLGSTLTALGYAIDRKHRYSK